MSEHPALKAAGRVAQSGLVPVSDGHALFLLLHAMIVQEGFVCIVEQGAATSGFAPSVRDLPSGKFVPDSWDQDPTSTNTRYKHRAAPGKQYNLIVLAMEGSVIITISQRNGDSFTLDLPFARHVHSSGQGREYLHIEELHKKLLEILHNLLPALKPAPALPAPALSPAGTASQTVPILGVGAMAMAPPDMFGVGRSDLDPVSRGPILLDPRFGQPDFGGPQGGSLIGPDHPMFSGHEPGGYPLRPSGFLGMYPRFDPIGPVPGSNSDLDFGEDFGQPFPGMLPGRGLGGRFAGRGGRGGRGHLFPGEPTPDHFKPPGW